MRERKRESERDRKRMRDREEKKRRERVGEIEGERVCVEEFIIDKIPILRYNCSYRKYYCLGYFVFYS